jgi:predicted transcriptional regulator
MQTPANEPKKETVLQKEIRLLSEDAKINFIMEMLSKIRFGKLVIHKYNDKITSYGFDGEVKFVISEFGAKKGPGPT